MGSRDCTQVEADENGTTVAQSATTTLSLSLSLPTCLPTCPPKPAGRKGKPNGGGGSLPQPVLYGRLVAGGQSRQRG